MNSNVYIARQPILDTNKELFAYELLYRNSNLKSEIKNDRHATVAVLSNALNKFGIKNLLGQNKAFIKADKKFLMHDVVFTTPKDYFILALQPTMRITPELQDRIILLNSMGYTLAINDVVLNENIFKNLLNILDFITYIKVDIKTPTDNLKVLKDKNIKIIFTKVESHEMYEKAKELNCDYVQGYFFAKPKVLQQKKFNADSLAVIKLCNYIMSDKSIDEIVKEFEKNHDISINLLRFINTATFNFRHKISSIKQILTLMGRTPLTQWLMLMVYSSNNSDKQDSQSPLMTLVKSRTNLMVEVSKYIEFEDSEKLASEVYFLGVISLMDTLFNVDIHNILDELNIDNDIKVALLNYEGILGEIYKFAKDIENFNIKDIEDFASKHHIEIDKLEKLTFDVIKNANEVEKTNE